MPLRIVRATDPMPVENIVLTIYAKPSHGKSSLSFTAEAPLMLDFDKGAYRACNRKDVVQVATWADVEVMSSDDLAPYSTIIVDTAGRALDVMGQDIIAKNPKFGRGGSLSLQGFGELKSRFAGWKNFLMSQKKDVVLVCHLDEQKNGDDTLERIDAQGASKNEIYKSSDAMARIQLGADGKRFLDFDPRENGFGKNPAGLPKIPFPHPDQQPDTLAKVIAQIKGSINRMTEAQAEAVKESEQWAAAIAECDTLATFNKLIVPQMKERGGQFVTMAAAEAKKRGYKGNKATGMYEETAVEAVA